MENQKKITLRVISILLITLIYTKSYEQYNLVANYSFENYSICPSINGYSKLPNPWYTPTTDFHQHGRYFNACCPLSQALSVPYNYFVVLSYQPARTGNAYTLIGTYDFDYTWQRIYTATKLKDTLIKDKKYYCEFYISLIDIARYGSNNIAILLTDTLAIGDTLFDGRPIIYANPQIIAYNNPIVTDTMNWVKINGIYKAKGGEKYLTIGNFKDNDSTQLKLANNSLQTGNGASYYLDDVSVIPLDSFCLQADAGRDTIIKPNDSVFIGSYTNGIDTIKWYNAQGQVIDSVQPGFWIKPNAVGSYMYIVEQTVNGCYSRDTVRVNVVLPLRMLNYELRILNEKAVLNKWETSNEVNVSHYIITRSEDGRNFKEVGKVKANNKASNEYSFTDQLTSNEKQETLYYRIAGIDKDGSKTYSEIRNIELRTRNNELRIYPNPARDIVNIIGNDIKEIKMLNTIGQTVYQTNNPAQHQSINTKQFIKGIYILNITSSSGKTENIKLVIE